MSNMKDGMVDKHIHTPPKEVICFDQGSIYKKIDVKEKELLELLKSDLTHHGIVGSDLPYKYGININFYTPYYEMKENFKWQKKESSN